MSFSFSNTGGSSGPDLEASDAEVSSLAKLFLGFPIVATQAITDPDVEVQIG